MNSEEFKERYLYFHSNLYRIALRILGNSSDAEDAIQEVYLKLWNLRYNLEETSNPLAFAITITKNLCIDRLRIKHTIHFNDHDHNLYISNDFNPYEQIEHTDNKNRLLKIIDLLPEPHKSVILFRDLENLSFEEMSTITGLSVNNLRVCLSRARKLVREEFVKFHQYGTERIEKTSGKIL